MRKYSKNFKNLMAGNNDGRNNKYVFCSKGSSVNIKDINNSN